jgi:ABC-type lipoprotein release transport system permease subunit
LLALTLLVAVVGGVVLTTLAGARRTDSVVERADDGYQVPDTFALFEGDSSFDKADAILASPLVEKGDRIAVVGAFTELGYMGLVASVDGPFGSEMFFDRVVDGRRPDPDAPLEVAIPEWVTQYNVGVGSTIPFHSASRAQGRCFFAYDPEEGSDPECDALHAVFEAEDADWGAFKGPSFDLEVVGIVRAFDRDDPGVENSAPVYLSNAFYREYGEQIPALPGVVARFRPGVTDRAFERALSEVIGPETLEDFAYSSTGFDALDATASTLANGLLIFAGVAAVAGLVAITQAIVRQAASGAADDEVIGALGATRAVRVLDPLLPLVPVAVGGSVLALAIAWLASPVMPVGSARDLEISAGFSFDAVVLVGGGAALALFVLLAGWAAAAWVGRRRGAGRSRMAAVVPPSIPAGLGLRWALTPGRAQNAIPVRSAVAGVALGVAGIIAVAAFAQGLERLTYEDARGGWGWDVAITGEQEQDPFDEAEDRAVDDARAEQILVDADVEGLTLGWLRLRAQVEGRSVPAYAERRYSGDVGFVVVDGRSPRGADEVALGSKTMRHADVGIGDDVAIGDRELRVVGQALFPNVEDGFPLAEGALFSDEGMTALGLDVAAAEQSIQRYWVQLRDGADGNAARERLSLLNGGEPPDEARQPTELRQLGQLDDLPTYLAIFLLLIASVALAHALVLTVRRRQRDVAVVRSLGATRGQSSRTIAWQASALATLGALVGLPIGIVIGRFVWAAVANAYGVADDPAWPVFALVLALPVSLLLANAIAWLPGRRAARIRPADALRTE